MPLLLITATLTKSGASSALGSAGLEEDSVGLAEGVSDDLAEAVGLLLGEALGEADGFAVDDADALGLAVIVVVVGVQAIETTDKVVATAKPYNSDFFMNIAKS